MAIKFLTLVGSQSYNNNNKFYVEVMNSKRQKEGKFGHAVYKFIIIIIIIIIISISLIRVWKIGWACSHWINI